jgi:ABC-type polysaccharide/polyol phosphate export permease
MQVLKEIMSRRELLFNLVAREVKIRYRGSVLGFLWTILIPLFMAMIYVVFLRLLAGRDVPIAEIIIGVFAWQFTVQAVNSGLCSVTSSANLVKKVQFPRILLPLSSTLANLVVYVMSLLVQFPLVGLILYMGGEGFTLWILAVPLVILFHFLFNLALALLLAGTNVYFRDMQHLVGVALSAWFFASPVMYNLTLVRDHAGHIPYLLDVFMLNPMAIIATAYRALMVPGVDFPWGPSVAASIIISLVLLVVGYRVFQRLQRDFADML